MVAGSDPATGWEWNGGASLRHATRFAWLREGVASVAAIIAAMLAFPSPATAASNARISGLSDAAFGTITNLSADSIKAQNICVFSNTATSGYHVTANGSGTSGAFTLASGPNSLAYQVQWNSSSGQSSGTQLTPNVALTGLTSSATQQACNNGPATSASLIVIIRSTALLRATAGAYNGTLTLVIGPE